jgi:hypothetical protein
MMKYFKSPDGEVYAYEADGSQDEWILTNLVPMTESEVEAHLNPPRDVLADQSAKLRGFVQLAAEQKLALTSRISTLNDAIDLEMATPEELEELPVRTDQLKQWKTYAVLLGRVTGQPGWPPEVEWPTQPTTGIDLSVSVTSPEAA